ncbi:hypothetical protein GGS24DRAFT_95963 [Hypoxylon argillaceum]|nr:hypothetical protein GGS24DRAFT_95963 [Hypoxylon argillaceum]
MAKSRKTPRNPPSAPVSASVPVTTAAAAAAATASTTSADSGPSAGALKQRRTGVAGSVAAQGKKISREMTADATMSWTARNQWMVYAVASGACAAFNGVFAKLTTNDLTGHIARGISGLFGIQGIDRVLEIAVRCSFFGLNLFFNGVMWTLFTQALAKGTSTTQVSIMNTSTNFMITALLGFAIFAEALPPLWWVGASLLVAGNVVIGRKDEGAEEMAGRGEEGGGEEAEQESGRVPDPKFKDDEDVPLLGDLDDPSDLHDR